MDPHVADLAAIVEQHRDALTESILRASRATGPGGQQGYSDADLTQMVHGFVALLREALAGGPGEVRALYLETLMPGLRDAGVTLHTMLSGTASVLVRVSCELAGRMPPETRERGVAWLGEFVGRYLADIAAVWAGRGH